MIVLTLLSIGGIIYATGQYHLGKDVDFLIALKAAANKFVALFLLTLVSVLIFVAPILLSFILIGIPILFFLVVRLYFVLQAVMLEDLGTADSISRSWRLVEGFWWRTFGIGAVFILLVFAATIAGSLLTIPLSALGGGILSSIVSALIGALVAPFMHIGATLVYLDLRVRREGGDVKIAT